MKITLNDVLNLTGLSNRDMPKVEEEVLSEEDRKILYEWTAVSKPPRKALNQKKLKTLMIVGIAVALLLVAMKEFFLLFGIVSVIFVSYMLNQAPEEHLNYQITNQGVKYGSKFYSWSKLKLFFFMHVEGKDILAVDVVNDIPGRLFFTLNDGDKDKVKELLDTYLTFLKEEPKNFVDRAFESVTDTLDLEEK